MRPTVLTNYLSGTEDRTTEDAAGSISWDRSCHRWGWLTRDTSPSYVYGKLAPLLRSAACVQTYYERTSVRARRPGCGRNRIEHLPIAGRCVVVCIVVFVMSSSDRWATRSPSDTDVVSSSFVVVGMLPDRMGYQESQRYRHRRRRRRPPSGCRRSRSALPGVALPTRGDGTAGLGPI